MEDEGKWRGASWHAYLGGVFVYPVLILLYCVLGTEGFDLCSGDVLDCWSDQ